MTRSNESERRAVVIDADGVALAADIDLPPGAIGLVLFAHGSGSSRRSPRNREVAERLQESNLATLLFDLLTEEESEVDAVTRHLRFDIDLLARRLTGATAWAAEERTFCDLPRGLFGASTGAAAALVTAATRPDLVRAVVSRGGRPDLAGEHLRAVLAPTLLIVGGADFQVLALNRTALESLNPRSRLEVVPDATHLFEEPGALAEVSNLAANWFASHLPR